MTQLATHRRNAAPRDMTTREVLLEAASTLMRERGTLGITLSDIAEKSGLNAALVKYYFGSKEGMMSALLERDSREAMDALKRLMGSGKSPTRKLAAHLTGLVRAYHRMPYLNQLMQAMVRDASDTSARAIIDMLVTPVAKAQAAILEQGMASGEFRTIDPDLFYFQAVSSAEGLYVQRFTYEWGFDRGELNEETHRRNVRQTVDILMQGVVRQPASGAG